MEDRSVRERRVLFVDDAVPEVSLGAGNPRLIETISTIQAMPGVSVTLYPTIDIIYPANEFGAIRPWQGEIPLEVVTGDLDDHLASLANERRGYDVVVISRPHNYEFVIDVIRRHLPNVPVVYDAEALFYRRMERQLDFVPAKDRDLLAAATVKMQILEERIAGEVEEMVFVSNEEAELLRPFARGPLTVNSPLLGSMRWTEARFADRKDVAFVAGWASGPKSPNIDGMQWFAREVWPRVLARHSGARLLVTGTDPPVEVRRFDCDSIDFVGRVNDLNDFYGRCRVVVVPNRFGAGVKNKTIEALQCGIPTVSTAVGAEGMPIPGFVDPTLSAQPRSPSYLTVTDDPRMFAAHVVTLLTDETAWEHERELLKIQCDAWEQARMDRTWTRVIDRVAPPSVLEVSAGRGDGRT